MRYLVTGGAGFIGSALTARLLDAGHEVCVLHRADDPRRLRKLACDSMRGDIRDIRAVSEAARGCDAVVHLAYVQRKQRGGYANSREVLDVAVRGMAVLLDVMESQGIGELMLVSSPEVYGAQGLVDETVPLTVPDVLDLGYSHGGGKIASELMAAAWARGSGFNRLTVARPHNVYGPDMGTEHVIPEFCLQMKLLAHGPHAAISDVMTEPLVFPIRGSGEEIRSFCWIGDCIDQLMLLLDTAPPLGIYHVGSEEQVSIARLAAMIAAFYARQVVIKAGDEGSPYPPCRLPDLGRIRELGYDPGQAMPLADGIKSTVSWYWANNA